MKTACIILAAGLGKRMKSSVPKVLHMVCGVPMLQSVINTAAKLKPWKVVIVAGEHIDLFKKSVGPEDILFALQKEAKGTGHALRCALPVLEGFDGTLIVMNGDTPLIGAGTLKKFLTLHGKNRNSISVLTFTTANPDDYGRIVRDDSGRLLSIIEDKDADPAQKKINEVNSGIYAINSDALYMLDKLKKNRAKGEYYLTDIIALSSIEGLKAAAYCIGIEEEFMGVNTREELHRASMLLKKQIINRWIGRGVNFLDAGSVLIHPGVSIGRETTIYPDVILEGDTWIGKGATIYPHVRIKNSRIGKETVIKYSTVIEDSVVKDRASVGPFAYIRPCSAVAGDAPSYAPALSRIVQKNIVDLVGKPRKSADGRTNSKNKRRKDG